jgi:signal transduction histidine kinase
MKMNNNTPANLVIGHELARAKQIINEFVYSCSHSMRGPLKSISGLVNLLQTSIRSGTDDPQHYLRLISQSVDKMETLLHQLEQFLENSKKDLTSEPVQIKDVVDDILQQLQPDIRANNIYVSSQVDQTGYFYSDLHRFRLILFHLLSNAIIFSDENKGSRYVEIDINATSASCCVQINDNGIGIPYEIQHRIFDLFYRGSEKSPGSGVGLHIVQEVLKKMGGSISVNSVARQGSNFFVWLPNMAQ